VRNVTDQRRDKDSLLNWTERVIRMRKECPEISWGNFEVLRTNVPEVLAIRYDWRDTSMLTVHNFSASKQKVKLKPNAKRDDVLVEVFDGHHSRAQNDGAHRVDLDGYGWRWFRVGAADNVLDRSDLDLAGSAPAA
jgi:maltose alpha-D-glucosyltransferase/alpha-amylase